MTALHGLRIHLRALFRRADTDRELDDELRFHLERDIARHVARGMSPDEARNESRRAFGNVTAVTETARAESRWGVLDDLRQDLRYAARSLRKRPGFTLVVVLTLALGIGVNSVVFSFVNLLFQPLPVRDPASVVTLDWTRAGALSRVWFTFDDFRYLRDHATSYTSLVATSGVQPLILGSDDGAATPEKIYGEFVSDGYFALLGGGVALGRPFTPEENQAPGAARAVVLSDRFWQARFGGDSSVVGRSLRINGQRFDVVGVAAAGFLGEGFGFRAPAIWVPMMMRAELAQAGGSWFSGPDADWLQLIGRLKPGKTLREAEHEAAILGTQLKTVHPDADARAGVSAFRGSPVHAGSDSDLGLIVLIAMLMPGLVLLIACANVANVLMARAAGRQKEFAVRLSLGASRSRLVRQLLAEGLLLALLGGVAAVVLTSVSVRAFAVDALTLFGQRDPVTAATRLVLDGRVLAVTALATLGAAVAFALVPALRATRTQLVPALKEEGAAVLGARISRSRLRNILVIAQVAISLLLLVTAAALLRWMMNFASVETGLDTRHAVVVDVRPSLIGYDSVRADQFQERLAMRIAAMPGVQSTGRALFAPFEGSLSTQVTVDGAASADVRRVGLNMVTPGFFDAVGLPLVRGRVFSADEWRSGALVGVISRSMARALWPDQDAVGKVLRWMNAGPRTREGVGSPAFVRVVGVVADAQVKRRLGTQREPYFYVPLPLMGGLSGSDAVALVRVTGDPRAVLPMIRAAIRQMDPAMWADAYPMEDALTGSEQVSLGRGIGTAAGALGTIAILLAAVGLYGVVAFSVTQRTREIGIRSALGATRTKVMATVLASGMRLVAIGAGVGIAAAALVSRALSTMLFGLRPFDPIAFAGTAAGLGAVALLAVYIPARRAARIDPMVALRHE